MATTAAVEVPFATASPEEIRAALLPEELPRFEEQYREALQVAAETFQLDKLEVCLRSWRRIAWMTSSDPQAHRRMLDKAPAHPGWRAVSLSVGRGDESQAAGPPGAVGVPRHH